MKHHNKVEYFNHEIANLETENTKAMAAGFNAAVGRCR